MSQTEAPTKQILMSDMFTNNEQIGARFFKVAADNPILAAALNDKAFSINASYSVPAGGSVGLNVNFASSVVIRRASTNNGLPISVLNSHATGDADGVFASSNLNMCSVDESPSTSQLYYNAVAKGNVISAGIGQIEPFIVSRENAKPCVFVTNTGNSATTISINLTFEEIGPRNPSFGLTASTLIEPSTEMSAYG
jgi:hypothetical protein